MLKHAWSLIAGFHFHRNDGYFLALSTKAHCHFASRVIPGILALIGRRGQSWGPWRHGELNRTAEGAYSLPATKRRNKSAFLYPQWLRICACLQDSWHLTLFIKICLQFTLFFSQLLISACLQNSWHLTLFIKICLLFTLFFPCSFVRGCRIRDLYVTKWRKTPRFDILLWLLFLVYLFSFASYDCCPYVAKP